MEVSTAAPASTSPTTCVPCGFWQCSARCRKSRVARQVLVAIGYGSHHRQPPATSKHRLRRGKPSSWLPTDLLPASCGQGERLPILHVKPQGDPAPLPAVQTVGLPRPLSQGQAKWQTGITWALLALLVCLPLLPHPASRPPMRQACQQSTAGRRSCGFYPLRGPSCVTQLAMQGPHWVSARVAPW